MQVHLVQSLHSGIWPSRGLLLSQKLVPLCPPAPKAGLRHRAHTNIPEARGKSCSRRRGSRKGSTSLSRRWSTHTFTPGVLDMAGGGGDPRDKYHPTEPIFTKSSGGGGGVVPSHEIIRPRERFTIKLMKPTSLGSLTCMGPFQGSIEILAMCLRGQTFSCKICKH